jgi:hypothetical protein
MQKHSLVFLIAAALAMLCLSGTSEGGGDDTGSLEKEHARLVPESQPKIKIPHESERTKVKAKRLGLPGPSLEDWKLASLWKPAADPEELLRFSEKFPFFATAQRYRSPIYRVVGKKLVRVGYARYGTYVRAAGEVEAPYCRHGKWYRVPGDGLVCTADGFSVADFPLELPDSFLAPEISRVEPFLYVKASKGSPRFSRLPTEEEELALEKCAKRDVKPDLIQEWLKGAYFLAVDRIEEVGRRRYYHTSMNRYVRVDDVEVLDQTQMHGELLGSEWKLPIAFVFGKDRTTYRMKDGGLEKAGVAVKHARFQVVRIFEHQGKNYAEGPGGVLVAREEVRVNRRMDRPKQIPKGTRWMHIELKEQTLTAYDEKDRPVLATLVSSGLDTHRTPTGTYQLERRYISKLMEGPDPDHGVYWVAEVPWTFYYRGNYAVHGAYWHNVFGEQRSHGCTNIPPADARWLFRWLEPEFPEGWHSMLFQEESWAHFTR